MQTYPESGYVCIQTYPESGYVCIRTYPNPDMFAFDVITTVLKIPEHFTTIVENILALLCVIHKFAF